MNKQILAPLLLALTIAHGADAVVIEYGRGNQMLIGKTMKAEEELTKGDAAAALREINAVVATDPKFFPAYMIRAEVYLAQGKWELAAQDCNTGLKIEPQLLDLAVIRASANAQLHKYAAALAELNHVIALHSPRPGLNAMAFNGRAWLRAACPDPAFRDGRKAVEDAKRACSLTGSQNSGYLDTLAAAYAEAGDFDSAIKYEQQAIKINGNSARYRAHLQSFQQRLAVRED
jgi:tetratricopeptide (TPR) repeat protein